MYALLTNMKRNLSAIIGLALLACGLPAGAQPPNFKPAATPPASTNDYSKIFKDDKERNGYAIGMSYGLSLPGNLKRSEVPYDQDALIKGFTAGVMSDTSRLNDTQVHEIIGILQREMRTRSAEKQKDAEAKKKADMEKNKKAGEAFLAAKKSEPGVIPLPSGLMYRVIKEGSGDSPKANDMVSVNYRGTLIDGTEFDSSAKTGKPATFRVNGVIKGWTEALELMKPGAKWTLYVPENMAYGDRGSPPKIEPGATLVFEVELLSVQPGQGASITPSAAPLTSDIIKVPSAEELKKGAKIETIKPEDIEKERLKEAAAKTNN
jgi:FKBP-type peptidyl-prolyl cis-trans isomerase FklB